VYKNIEVLPNTKDDVNLDHYTTVCRLNGSGALPLPGERVLDDAPALASLQRYCWGVPVLCIGACEDNRYVDICWQE
jgi:hypothetical protein